MNRAEIRNTVRNLLREQYGESITDIYLNDLINRAYQEIARITSCFRSESPVTSDSNGFVDIPLRFHKIMQVIYNNRPLSTTTEVELDIYRPNWRTETGSAPELWFFHTGNRIRLVPRPASGTFSVVIAGFVIPFQGDTEYPLLTSDTDSPKLPEAFHRTIAYKVILDLAATMPEDAAIQARAQQVAPLYNNDVTELAVKVLPPRQRPMTLPLPVTPAESSRRS